MKKYLIIASFILILVITISGCTDDGNNPGTNDQQSNDQQSNNQQSGSSSNGYSTGNSGSNSAGAYHECHMCLATGRCKVCEGTGVYSTDGSVCEFCSGTGICSDCGGSGYTDKVQPETGLPMQHDQKNLGKYGQ